VRGWIRRIQFKGSAGYWDKRYRSGGISGPGSRGSAATFKAEVLNEFVRTNRIESVIEFGCGDGFQLSLARYPRYIGLDVSPTAIAMCGGRFADDATKSFLLYSPDAFFDTGGVLRSQLALSLDVVFHLIEDHVFERYMTHLFAAATSFVIVYSTNVDEIRSAEHVRHRHFTDWVSRNEPGWTLSAHVGNPEPAAAPSEPRSDFFVFAPRADGPLVHEADAPEEGVRSESMLH
jgi:hypothetical protein